MTSNGPSPIPSYFELKFTPQSGVRFDYHLIKLSHLDYRRFLESKNPLAYALMAKMKYSRRERVRLKADFLASDSASRSRSRRDVVYWSILWKPTCRSGATKKFSLKN